MMIAVIILTRRKLSVTLSSVILREGFVVTTSSASLVGVSATKTTTAETVLMKTVMICVCILKCFKKFKGYRHLQGKQNSSGLQIEVAY